MKWHPAKLMIWTWVVVATIFIVLPLHIVNRQISVYGYVILALFILTFAVGAWLRTPALAQKHAPAIDPPDFRIADIVIAVVAIVATVVLLADLASGAGADLNAAWQVRDDRAGAILAGTESGSSFLFQLGFLTAPVAYVAIAREVIFNAKIRFVRLFAFGFAPLVASSLALGGRGPLLFALTMFLLSFQVRRFIADRPKVKRERSPRQVFLIAAFTVVALASLNYFVQVFNVRAASAGGGAVILDMTGETWGVTFDGPMADWMVAVLGGGNTYIIFVFAWYLTQGMVIANVLFTSYAGPAMGGLYGIELLIAAARRIDGNIIADRYVFLNDLNVFGFVSSAFGTLYVDYWFFGFVVALLWGYVAGLVYERSRLSEDGRWLIAVPFVVQGVMFSVINTPIGLSNGLVTHFWMIVVVLLSRPLAARLPRAAVPAE